MGTTSEIKFGCVRFDDVNEHNRGWAAIAGEKPFRIASTRDLHSSLIWLHNLDYEMTFTAGMDNHAGLRRNDYLSERFINSPKDRASSVDSDAAYDISGLLGSAPTNAAQQVSRMAAIFNRVMSISDLLGVHDTPMKQLSHGFRDLAHGYDPVLPEEIINAISMATVHFVSAERDSRQAGLAQKMVLSLPKVDHGLRCANVLMPSSKWIDVSPPDNHSPDAIAQWMESLGETGVYSLVECTIESVSELAHKLLNYGSGRRVRRWMTGIELQMVNKIASVTIKKAYVPADIKSIDFIQTILERHNPIHELSLSMGLVWQNVWLSLGVKKTPPPHIRRNGHAINPLTPFIKSIDRNTCLLAALELQAHGVAISGYGKGKIQILHDGDNDLLVNACRKAGVIPPFLNMPIDEDVAIDTPKAMFREIYIQGDYEQLESADQQIFESIIDA